MDIDKKTRKRKQETPGRFSVVKGGFVTYLVWFITVLILTINVIIGNCQVWEDFSENRDRALKKFTTKEVREFTELKSMTEYDHGRLRNDYYILCRDIETGKETAISVTRETYMGFEPGKKVKFKVSRRDYVPENIENPKYWDSIALRAGLFPAFLLLAVLLGNVIFWSYVQWMNRIHKNRDKYGYAQWITNSTPAERTVLYSNLSDGLFECPMIIGACTAIASWLDLFLFIIVCVLTS